MERILGMRLIRPIFWLLFGMLLLSGCSKNQPVLLQGYVEGQFIYLSSSVSGLLKSLLVYRGDSVKEDQTLFILDPEPQESELQEAKAKLTQEKENLENLVKGQRQTILNRIIAEREQAIADMIYAQQTLTRFQHLYRVRAISKDELDKATADYKAKKQIVNQTEANLAEAQLGERKHLILAQQAVVDAAQANVAKLIWELDQKTVVAPKNGNIFDTFFKVGEYVPAGQPVTALLTPNNIKLIFYIPEPLLSRLKLGTVVEFKCDGCTIQRAKVTYISPEAEYTPPIIYSQKSRAKLVYRVECAIPEKNALKFHAGQPVDVYLHEESLSDSHA
ncbi:HlyD family efflux transporter periplasmic adaptor subunit [Coxiella burnetii]|uniref:HlyD family secretion protein n=1 Tax=Coxiella burnetii TaxID=777 RepID=UPI000F51AFA2|nr:HlyD family efflux transporter periplasmic adaptor subunit [Coxiella burnetii]AZV74588.1 HlyD family efflux transporter periplasmic adaptor subunit [Coxiella burnetii]RQM79601.1 HlyD family efflux transporter periplasmic adaptor subunit [Coxiella burnetii]